MTDASEVEDATVSRMREVGRCVLAVFVIQSDRYFGRLVARQKSAWATLFKQTGRSPYVALDAVEYTGMVRASSPIPAGSAFMGALGTVAGAVGNTALEGGAAELGVAATRAAMAKATTVKGVTRFSALLKAFRGAGVPGFLFSTVTNIVWDVISGLLGTEPDVGEVVDAGIKDSHTARSAVEAAIDAASEPKQSQASESIRKAHEYALECDDHEALRSVLEWALHNLSALAELPSETDTELSAKLLAQWVLQHSATPEEANEDTTQKTFEDVKGDVKKPLLEGRRDLFIHQCKYAWGRMGVDLARACQTLHRALAPHAHKDASDIVESLEGMSVALDPIQDGAAFASYLEREQPIGGLLGPAHAIQEDPARAAAHRTFDLGCKLELKEADGAVCLEALTFDLVPHPGYNAFALEARSYDAPDAPELSAIASRHWDYSPR